MYELLVWSRFSNRVYIEVDTLKTEDFDSLYDKLASIEWSNYITGKEYIVVEAASTRSTLESVPAIQSISKKAIFSTLRTPNLNNGTEVHILILLIDNIAHILLDITGDPLHKRGYRREAWEAPIKENLAAALVAFANWKYATPLFDPMCGSGTIAIEAAMLARNIAPWLSRRFRISELPIFNKNLYLQVVEKAKAKMYPSGKYKIYASDLNPEMIAMAESNAKRAWVESDIIFSNQDFISYEIPEGVIISNPPYGNRLQNFEIDSIYTKLIKHITQFGGGFITSHPIESKHQLANKKLLNGWEECRFWYKKF